jgi:peptide/nickel transport system permease protein
MRDRELLDVPTEAPEPGAPGGLGVDAEAVGRSQWRVLIRRFLRHRLAVVSIVVLVLIAVACFAADWLAPYAKNDQGGLTAGPSAQHWFGTDDLGRDLLTEMMYAGQISLQIGFGVALISTAVGVAIGALAGYFSRWTDQLLMRVTDLFLVVPAIAILLAMAIKEFGDSTATIVLILAGLGWMYIARVVRGQTLTLKEREFVEAARASGASNTRIIGRHLVPNMMGAILVNATLAIAAAIIAESTLSFLGFGVQPPTTSWGRMLADAKGYVGTDKAYLVYFPGLALLIVVLAVNFIGDGLRDSFDPQSSR